MSEEEKKDETVEPIEEVKVTPEEIKTDAVTDAEVEKTSPEAKDIEKTIDYETKLSELETRTKKAEETLAGDRYKNTHLKEEDEVIEPVVAEDSVTKADIEALLEKNRQDNLKVMEQAKIKELASTITNSPAEEKLVLAIHKERQFPSYMSLDDQIKESFVLANSDKLIGERDEAVRALKNKNNINTTAENDNPDQPKGPGPKVAGDVVSILTQKGFKLNSVSQRYEKTIKGGTSFYYDLPTKKLVKFSKSN